MESWSVLLFNAHMNMSHGLIWVFANENNRFYRNAIKCYDNSLKIFQDDEDAWLNEANCYLKLKNSYIVKFCYKKVLEISPSIEYANDMLNNV